MKQPAIIPVAVAVLLALCASAVLAFDAPQAGHGFNGAQDISKIERVINETFVDAVIRHVEYEESDGRGVAVEAEVIHAGGAASLVLLRQGNVWRIVEQEKLGSSQRLRRHFDRLRRAFEEAGGDGPGAVAAAIERRYPGAIVLEIDLELEAGRAAYEVEIFSDGAVREVHSEVRAADIQPAERESQADRIDGAISGENTPRPDRDSTRTRSVLFSVEAAKTHGVPFGLTVLQADGREIAHAVQILTEEGARELWFDPADAGLLADRDSPVEPPAMPLKGDPFVKLVGALDEAWKSLGWETGYPFANAQLASDAAAPGKWHLRTTTRQGRPGTVLTATFGPSGELLMALEKPHEIDDTDSVTGE
jgi:hypothetical protein